MTRDNRSVRARNEQYRDLHDVYAAKVFESIVEFADVARILKNQYPSDFEKAKSDLIASVHEIGVNVPEEIRNATITALYGSLL